MVTLLKTDAYKLHHREQYPKGTEFIYSNLTPRRLNYFEKDYGKTDYIICYGANYIIEKLHLEWQENFFNLKWKHILKELNKFMEYSKIDISKNIPFYKQLHKYGHLPIKFKSLRNYSKLYPNTPVIVFWNTHKKFYWLVNYIETWLSAEFWPIITTANISKKLYELAFEFAHLTCENDSHLAFQFHDFSYRGISSTESAIKTGLGHLSYFLGTDNLPAIMEKGNYRSLHDHTQPFYGTSIPATEHSVMCANGQENELQTFSRLLDLYPTGIVSIVSDTWDIFHVCNNILPKLKEKILARDGKVVIRPDSGDPVDISIKVIKLLEKHFGTYINKKGFRVLNSKVGVIYGDSITYAVAKQLFLNLKKLGYASSNIVFGIGSYSYQYITRDTLSIAVKSTAVKIKKKWNPIQKNPITDVHKKSLTGFLTWQTDEKGIYYCIDKQPKERYFNDKNKW